MTFMWRIFFSTIILPQMDFQMWLRMKSVLLRLLTGVTRSSGMLRNAWRLHMPTSLGGWCQINLYLMYNLLAYQLEYRENWRTLKGQSGIPLSIPHLCVEIKFEFQMLRSMQFSVQLYVPRSQSAIRVMNDEVAEHLEATSLPLHHL